MRGVAEIGALVATGAVPVLAYCVLGGWILRWLRLAADGSEAWALAWAFGTGAASLLLLVLRMGGLPLPLFALAVFGVAGGAWLVRNRRRALPRDDPGWVRAVDAATCAIGLLTFAAALAPETYWDGFEYHLPMVRAWSEGPVRALPGMLDAELRAGVDLLYLPAVAAGRPDAAAAVSAGFAVALAALVRAEARRRATPGVGALAGFFTLVVPFTLELAPSSYVDLGVGCYGFLALLFADRWNRGGEPVCLHAGALCLVFAVNAKLHALALVPACLVVVSLGGRSAGVRPLLACAGILVAGELPWLVKSALATGNPFFPLWVEVFGSGWVDPEHLALRRLRLATDHAGPPGALGFLDYLASMLAGRNPHLSGLVGPLPFALLPLALQRPTRPTLVLAATLALLFVLQFAFMPALRFGAPILAFAALGTAWGGARLARSGPAPRRILAATLAVLALHHLAGVASRYGPRLVALAEPRAYEEARFPDQVNLAKTVSLGRGGVAIPKGAVLWMPRPVYVLHWERNGELFFDRVRGRRTPPAKALRLLEQRGVGSLVLDVAGPPAGRRVGHSTVDTWIDAGLAHRRTELPPLPARAGRFWVLVDLD